MSVLIKGMEMPKSCIDCAFGWNGWCHRINSRAFVEVDMRRHDCPLIEVPDGHGRLIDADELAKDYDSFPTRIDPWVWNELSHAPTVIPADREEEQI